MAILFSLMNLTKRRSSARSLATFGLGVVLAGFSAAPAQALTANSGTDYLLTPTGGANFVFTPPGGNPVDIPYSGLPILTPTPNGSPNGGYSGIADTVVNRLQTVTATPSGGVTPIEVVGLSLFAKNVNLPLLGGPYDTVAGLQKYYGNTGGGGPTSVGTMTIRSALTGLPPTDQPTTWDSDFTVKAVAFFAAPGTLALTSNPYALTHSPDLVRNIIGGITTPIPGDPSELYACQSGSIPGQCLLFDKRFILNGGGWAETPSGQISGENLVSNLPPNFYLTEQAPHVSPDGSIHTVDQFVPGPLPILGLGAALTASRRLKKLSCKP